MKTLANRFGSNRWFMFVHLLSFASGIAHAYTYVRNPGWDVVIMRGFFLYAIIAMETTQKRIFQNNPKPLNPEPPINPQWKRWFFTLYIPHVIYCLWYAYWMVIVNHAPQGLLVSAAILLCLCCAYLRLSTMTSDSSKKD